MIKINYNTYLINNWKDVISYHLSQIVASALYDDVDEFNIFAYPYNDQLMKIVSSIIKNANVIWKKTNDYEFSAIEDIINSPLDKNLYFHSKGVSKGAENKNVSVWNEYMTFFNIHCYKRCLDMLDENDCVGCEFKTQPFPHYCGNFWWSTRYHLDKIRDSQHWWNRENRMDAEKIIGSVGGRFISLCNSGVNLYEEQFCREKWILKEQKFNI